MYDYVYFDITGISIEEFYENTLLVFVAPANCKTGEPVSVSNTDRKKRRFKPTDEKIAEYKNCKFILTNNKHINFSGSLHYYRHNGINYNDFLFKEFFAVIQDLDKKFNINPFLSPIHNVEFGVNVVLPFNTKAFINSIICFKGKEYSFEEFKGDGYMFRFSFNQYEVKIYDKGFQNRLEENILRFEIKVTTMHFLRSKGIKIYNLADLLNPYIQERLGLLLNDFFDQLVIFDPSIQTDLLNGKKRGMREKEILMNGQNPKYWRNLKKENPECYKKRLVRFRTLVKQLGKDKWQNTVSGLIKNKWKQISRADKATLKSVNEYLKEAKHKQETTFPNLTAYLKS